MALTPEQMQEIIRDTFSELGARTYVGMRYVPKFVGEWSDENEYESLSIVYHSGKTYTSKCFVPVGVSISNANFWALSYEYVPSEAQLQAIIDAWLVAHPEATTTVQDNSINGATKIIDGSIPDSKLVQYGGILQKVSFINSYSHNMIDPAQVDYGLYWSPGAQELRVPASDVRYATTAFIEVEEGETYCYSGTAIYAGGYFTEGQSRVAGTSGVAITTFAPVSGSGHCFTVPSGYKYVCINLNTNADKTAIYGTFQLERGNAATEIVPYRETHTLSDTTILTDNYADGSIVTPKYADASVTPQKASFFDYYSHNMIDPAQVDYGLYWSPGAQELRVPASDVRYATTAFIEVEEGETYCYSGTAIYAGGYFTEGQSRVAGTSGVAITTFAPVSGSGSCFTVPSGYKYVCLNLITNADKTAIDGTFQLERGEMPTPIVPYNLKYVISDEYLPNSDTPLEPSSILQLPSPSYAFEYDKISSFMGHHMAKDKDLMIVGTGTSLTARSSEHCTLRADATSRPPLLHSNNFASLIWDRLKWAGQKYRRFDYSGFFSETGTFATSANLDDWDDATYRYGITRYASGPASVAFVIPDDAWQFNFIYRSDQYGSESVSIAVAEGSGKVEVFNGSTWVEANGHTFSMREAVTTLSNIEVCDPNTVGNTKVSRSSYQVGGNTTYQKRLKMRCKSNIIDSIGDEKTVTISASNGRLLYWGVEWSPREFMITYVNAARGSHGITYDSARSLYNYQDNEIWSFKPDLIFTENPIHNSGASGGSVASYYTTYWGYATYDFFFNTDNPISLASRALANGVTGLEWVVFTSSISWNFNGIDDNGELKLYPDRNGLVLSGLDAQTLCHKWIIDNEPDVLSINACKYWCDAGVTLFGDLKTATLGSGKDGDTFTNEGSHWNDTGSAVMDRCIGGVFDFYN